MRDQEPTKTGATTQTAHAAHSAAAPQPGRSALAHDASHGAGTAPLFGDDAQWEAAEPAPNPAGFSMTVFSDDHHDGTKSPFEHQDKKSDNHWAARSAENRGTVHSDKTSATTAGGRPGVVVDHNSFFRLNRAVAVRYTFSASDNANGKGVTNHATPFDDVNRKDLADYNFNDKGALTKKEKAQVKGKSQRLLLNPAEPRKLTINGKEETCVLSWVDGKGAAWLPLADLAGNTKALEAAVAKIASHEDPKAVMGKSTKYVVRNDGVGHAETGKAGDAPGGKDKVLGPHEKGGDNVVHYLEKDQRKPVIGADGKPTGENHWVGFAALCMNLPEPGTAPVAIDTLTAGETFFVMNGAQYHQSVAVYANGAGKSHERMEWVFGHIGKSGAQGAAEPDPSRRGWVPLRILALASQEHEKQETKSK